eukprot:TRINITY_DN5339_c0_g1_i2.p1 TRINITY_DN5339_c0_g1~~TRINITY_DN5339_c0_g1_i2.p1  ORF type:complete len:1275 (+),score=186.31 TRINITY_DN5339_c0_g1_i2:94-3825(+)
MESAKRTHSASDPSPTSGVASDTAPSLFASTTVVKAYTNKLASDGPPFDLCVIVGLKEDESSVFPSPGSGAGASVGAQLNDSGGQRGVSTNNSNNNAEASLSPVALFSYPDGQGRAMEGPIATIQKFCFPDIGSFLTRAAPGRWRVKKQNFEEKFSFVLTEETGLRRWGYCKRILPLPVPGSNAQSSSGDLASLAARSKDPLPLCFCLLGVIPCYEIFSKLLDDLANLYLTSTPGSFDACQALLKAVWNQALPAPGQSINVTLRGSAIFGSDSSPFRRQRTATLGPASPRSAVHFIYHRSEESDSLLDHVNFGPLLRSLDPYAILSIFASMLVERRLLFIADKLETLTASVQAAVALLYPFTWQHVLVPVLPASLLSFCCAPVPFVCGILRSSIPALKQYSHSMEAVIIVDLDNNQVITPALDDSKAYPERTGENKNCNQDFDLLPPALVQPLIAALQRGCKEVKLLSKLHRKRRKLSKLGLHGDSSSEGSSYSHRKTVEKRMRAQRKELANAFIAFMVDLLSTYRLYLVPCQESSSPQRRRNTTAVMTGDLRDLNLPKRVDIRWKFEKAAFLEDQPNELKPFLMLFAQSQLFDVFVDGRINMLEGGGNTRGEKKTKPSTDARRIRSEDLSTPDPPDESDEQGKEQYMSKFEKRVTRRLRQSAVPKLNNEITDEPVLRLENLPARSRFTLYERGQISREAITKAFESMAPKPEREGLSLPPIVEEGNSEEFPSKRGRPPSDPAENEMEAPVEAKLNISEVISFQHVFHAKPHVESVLEYVYASQKPRNKKKPLSGEPVELDQIFGICTDLSAARKGALVVRVKPEGPPLLPSKPCLDNPLNPSKRKKRYVGGRDEDQWKAQIAAAEAAGKRRKSLSKNLSNSMKLKRKQRRGLEDVVDDLERPPPSNLVTIVNRPICAEGTMCVCDDPQHWVIFQHTPMRSDTSPETPREKKADENQSRTADPEPQAEPARKTPNSPSRQRKDRRFTISLSSLTSGHKTPAVPGSGPGISSLLRRHDQASPPPSGRGSELDMDDTEDDLLNSAKGSVIQAKKVAMFQRIAKIGEGSTSSHSNTRSRTIETESEDEEHSFGTEVEMFLRELGLEAHMEAFRREDIGMADLPLLSNEDFVALGLKLGPRRRIRLSLQRRAAEQQAAQRKTKNSGTTSGGGSGSGSGGDNEGGSASAPQTERPMPLPWTYHHHSGSVDTRKSPKTPPEQSGHSKKKKKKKKKTNKTTTDDNSDGRS